MGNCVAKVRNKRRKNIIKSFRKNRGYKKNTKPKNQPTKEPTEVTKEPTKPKKVTNLPTNQRGISGKKAVLVGLNYPGTRAALQGCINDATRMEQTLKTKYNYTDTTVLTDSDLSRNNNILQVLDSLVDSNNTTLFFQYSGHGTQVRDYNGDEADHKDEALYSVGGTIIIDDDINKRIKRVPSGSTLIMIIDACHSGTMVDLQYQLVGNNVVKVNSNQVNGNIICISGCRDTQVSMDVKAGATAYGAMSNALQYVLKKSTSKTTWRQVIDEVNTKLKLNNFTQLPQLCLSKPELVDMVINL